MRAPPTVSLPAAVGTSAIHTSATEAIIRRNARRVRWLETMFQVENAMCDLRKKQQREKRAERSERVKREEGREQRGKSAERRRNRETSRFAPGASSEGLPPRERDTHGLRHAELRQTNRIVARQVLPPMLPGEHAHQKLEAPKLSRWRRRGRQQGWSRRGRQQEWSRRGRQ